MRSEGAQAQNQIKKTKKIPERQCLGCGEHKPKGELCRIVRAPDGTVSIDKTGKKAGRGAYICQSAACLAKVRKNRRAESNLGCDIPAEVWEALAAELGAEI